MPLRRWPRLFVPCGIFATRGSTETGVRPISEPTGSMTTMHDFAVLEVLFHGKPIGTLTRLPGDRVLFAFTEDYIAVENRPPPSLSFQRAHRAPLNALQPTH